VLFYENSQESGEKKYWVLLWFENTSGPFFFPSFLKYYPRPKATGTPDHGLKLQNTRSQNKPFIFIS
jgi:hypothetical protein